MIVVIIAGGSGTRLWPLSTPDYPKHLLELGGEESLLQNAFRRAKKVADTVYVITEAGHADHVRTQLSELPNNGLIVEPARRGTANCLLAGLHAVAAHHSPDEPIGFIAADHSIRDAEGFAQSFRIAAAATKKYNRICLVGVEPSYPSTGFGYIEKANLMPGEDMVYDVARFKEKPAYDVAKEYVQSGRYLWNCSYFVASHHTFMDAINDHSPVMKDSYQKLSATKTSDEFKQAYLALPTDTIDFALSDHVDNFMVVPATFDWMDVGSFKDLYDITDGDDNGNAVRGGRVLLDGVKDSLIRNEEDKPLAVIGLKDVVVVNTPNGIIVAHKDKAQKVGDAAKKFNAQK